MAGGWVGGHSLVGRSGKPRAGRARLPDTGGFRIGGPYYQGAVVITVGEIGYVVSVAMPTVILVEHFRQPFDRTSATQFPDQAAM